MKHIRFSIFTFFIYVAGFSQKGNVGINTSNPEARADILSTLGTTSDTKSLRIVNNSGIENLTLLNSGKLGQYTTAPTATYDITSPTVTNNNSTDLVFDNTQNSFFVHRFATIGGQYGNGNMGGQNFEFQSTPSQTSGLYIGPSNGNINGGLYLAENGYNGFGTSAKPQVRLDVGGSIRISTASPINPNAICTKPGELAYYKGHFYGCGGSTNTWKQLDE